MIPSHHIQTLKFELDIPSKEKNRDIQNRVINIFNGQFIAMLNDVFSKHNNDEDIIIDKLHLQLEPIPAHKLESNLTEHSRREIIKYLEIYNSELNRNKKDLNANTNKEKQVLHPLLHYLLHGIISWDSKPMHSFTSDWLKALKHSDFKSKCNAILWHHSAIVRLSNQLDASSFRITIQKLFPSNSIKILLIVDQLKAIPIVNNGKNYIKNDNIHKIVLTYLWENKNESLNIEDFTRYYFQHLSSQHKISIVKILDNVGDGLGRKQLSDNNSKEFLKLIYTIKEKITYQSNSNSGLISNKSIKDIETYLLKTHTTKDELLEVEIWLLTPHNRRSIQKEWVEPLKGTLLKRTVSVLSPKGAMFVFNYHNIVFNKANSNQISASKESFQKAVWTFTLDYFINSFSSDFQAKEFINYQTNKLSNYYGLSRAFLIKELLSSIDLMPDSSIKYDSLLTVLKSMIIDQKKTPLFLANKHSKTPKESEIDEIVKMLDCKKKLSFEQGIKLKHWLLDKRSFLTIKKMWISSNNELILNEFIKTLVPQNHFIKNSIEIIIQLFESKCTSEKQALDLKKKLYENIFLYLHLNANPFEEKSYLKFHFNWLLIHFKMNYKELLSLYTKFLNGNQNKLIGQIEFFKNFNELQSIIEEKHICKFDIENFDKELDLKVLADYFLEVKNVNSLQLKNSFSLNKLQSIFELMIAKRPRDWLLYLQSRSKIFQFNKTILLHIKATLLRQVHEFNLQYIKWKIVKKSLVEYSALHAIEADLIFLIEEGVYPLWSQNNTNVEIEKVFVSDHFKATIYKYNWTDLRLDNWTNKISSNMKTKFLLSYVKVHKKKNIAEFYKSLNRVYDKLSHHLKPLTFKVFERSFWRIFFKALRINNSISSSEFKRVFLQQWKDVFNIQLTNNLKVERLFVSSVFYEKAGNEKSNKLLHDLSFGDNKTLNDQENKITPLSLDLKSKSMQEQLVKWYINSAGQIIVHPFLVHLFKRLNYIKDKMFETDEKQSRAAYLLHYIATGDFNIDNEADLAMSKILCGMSIEQSLFKKIELTKEEKNTAIEMLDIVIERWDKLGNTSIEGIRNTFLHRAGLLELRDNAYQLTLESSGTDVLLDFIPWSINMIQLPWMDKIIYISWR